MKAQRDYKVAPAKTNVSFPRLQPIFVPMNEHLKDAILSIVKGDTGFAESFFRRPGGRRYLENISLILIHTLVPHATEKEEMYLGFVEVLDRMEQRIQRQQEGEEILEEALCNS
jgi:hypothetical protein